ncbi:unnamed protein product, partial [marine sediment metagenome]
SYKARLAKGLKSKRIYKKQLITKKQYEKIKRLKK